jgi:spermidine synthase
MAMEVVWTRAFTPALKTQVYSFAMVLFTYLGATFAGSYLYRRDLRQNMVKSSAVLLLFLPAAAYLPLVINDPRFIRMEWGPEMFFGGIIAVLASIIPLCGILGYLTPRLIDEYSDGNPARAGRAYSLNVIGCILGPLVASYLLLPSINERDSLLILGFPFLLFCALCFKSARPQWRIVSSLATISVLIVALFFSATFEGQLVKNEPHIQVRSDYVASVISLGEGMHRQILVNGMGMTALTPTTKFMVHLPLSLREGPPADSALVICFGMGTTYRASLTWDIDTTAVELVPSVRDAFGFYHADAAKYINSPKGRIIADDGRRFLSRTRKMFDVIVIDPPPPVEAAGSSLLYSEEFYALAKQHLKPHGILQAWFPMGELYTAQAVLRSLKNSFPYIRCYAGIGGVGNHFFASMDPINIPPAETLAERMPPAARRDLLEWSRTPDLATYIREVLKDEVNIDRVLNPNLEIRITDDHPYNEYFLLRRSNLTSP